jgi:hypothetical protein
VSPLPVDSLPGVAPRETSGKPAAVSSALRQSLAAAGTRAAAAPREPATAAAGNPLNKIPSSVLPPGRSKFEFSAGPVSGAGWINRDQNKLTIHGEPSIGRPRTSTLTADPGNPDNVQVTRHDGEKFSGPLNVDPASGSFSIRDGNGHGISIRPSGPGAFDMNSEGFGLESRVKTKVRHLQPE